MYTIDSSNLKRFLTPFAEAIEELKRRKQDRVLEERVREYLNADIPNYFFDAPVFYLARHVATPNFETLRFMHLLDSAGFKTIISQDEKDMFVASNPMKKALIKAPIHTGFSLKDKKYHERFQYESIGDINQANGKQFSEITTHWGQPLIGFHKELCEIYFGDRVQVIDDSAWIDRNHRGNLLEHYKRFLALFIVHGVLFEDYLIEDEQERDFIDKVLAPAFAWVEEYFGCKPLIAQLNPTSAESEHFWISYPARVGEIIKNKYTSK